MQDMLQLAILNEDEELSKDAKKKYKKSANPGMIFGQVEIGLDESRDDLYALVWDQEIRYLCIQYLCDIKTLWADTK